MHNAKHALRNVGSSCVTLRSNLHSFMKYVSQQESMQRSQVQSLTSLGMAGKTSTWSLRELLLGSMSNSQLDGLLDWLSMKQLPMFLSSQGDLGSITFSQPNSQGRCTCTMSHNPQTKDVLPSLSFSSSLNKPSYWVFSIFWSLQHGSHPLDWGTAASPLVCKSTDIYSALTSLDLLAPSMIDHTLQSSHYPPVTGA